MVRVKLCGMMSEEDLARAESAGADAVGFVTEYPVEVPWNLSVETSAELISKASPFITTVAVVGGRPERVVQIAMKVRPKVLQLHGDESLEEIRRVVRQLRGTGIRVIKAMRVDIDSGLARFDETDPVRAGRILAGSGIGALIMDSKTTSMPAGTGVPLDWEMAAAVGRQSGFPLILAGGLTARNVADAVRVVDPYAVDVISGVEDEAGVKNFEKMKAFVAAAKGIKNAA